MRGEDPIPRLAGTLALLDGDDNPRSVGPNPRPIFGSTLYRSPLPCRHGFRLRLTGLTGFAETVVPCAFVSEAIDFVGGRWVNRTPDPCDVNTLDPTQSSPFCP